MASRIKLGVYITALAGLGLLVALLLYSGFDDIIDALEVAGWGLFWLVPLHLLPMGMDARGWRILLASRDPRRRAGWGFLVWVASVRDAVSSLLPVARVGGDLVGIRLVMLRGINGAVVSATVLVEMCATAVNQYLLAVLGLILLFYEVGLDPLLVHVAIGLLLALPLLAGMLSLLRFGSIFQRLQRLVEKIMGGRDKLTPLLGDVSALDGEIRALFAQPVRVVRFGLWQFAGMVVGSVEIWVTLRLLHHPVGVVKPVILESLSQVVRHLAFMIPAGLGVQEAGFVVFGGLLGLGGNLALALSLANRLRELAFGIPVIVSWQFVEGRRLRRLFRLRSLRARRQGRQRTR